MHAETLRVVTRSKLPFAEYSVRSLKISRQMTRLNLPLVIGSGSHPFPFRTRKLSLIPPMVLYGKLYGRVGRCRHYFDQPAGPHPRVFLCTAAAAQPHPIRRRRGGQRPATDNPLRFGAD